MGLEESRLSEEGRVVAVTGLNDVRKVVVVGGQVPLVGVEGEWVTVAGSECGRC